LSICCDKELWMEKSVLHNPKCMKK
jgi:hypothetical protein